MTTPGTSHETTDSGAANSTETDAGEGADPGICPWCQAPVPAQSGRGRPRVWCSDQCRRDAHNARKAARAGAVGMQVIRQTRTIEKPVPVPAVEYRDPTAAASPARYLDNHDVASHVLRNPDLLAKILDMFSAGLRSLPPGRELTTPLHEASLRLGPLLKNYLRATTPPEPETETDDETAGLSQTAGLSRQQRRARQRLQAKTVRP